MPFKKQARHEDTHIDEFDMIRLTVASAEQVLKWSHGEVTKPETINYRTQKPETDGLFCERIFGPVKDFECYCGKYKKIRYKGVVCDRCGVEVTRSLVRRERMGHIVLAVPAAHIWYLKGVPSRLSLLLDMSVRDLERIIYFGAYIITEVDEKKREKVLADLEENYQKYLLELDKEFAEREAELAKQREETLASAKPEKKDKIEGQFLTQKERLTAQKMERREDISKTYQSAVIEVRALDKLSVISEIRLLDLKGKYGELVKVGIGAEAIFDILKKTDFEKIWADLKKEIETAQGQKRRKLIRRYAFIKGMLAAGIKAENMIIKIVPVIPPDLRPMVQLDGGRYAASDLNDLYRRVINRNNRLKHLLELGAPEVITRNEKRMLQEAVDALIDNSARKGKEVTTARNKRKLKSLSDMLRGKQGRFRQNLLGKRVDYSGRSVIVVGPELKLHQCGLPKRMVLELFKPFVVGALIRKGYTHNVKAASRLIERSAPEVWEVLEEIIADKYVMLNRAPTLHRLGIQAFQPVLIEGKAIQIHPLVCTAFNADFDGDQMAVHVPLSSKAQEEAKTIMLSSHNLLKPAAGEPVVFPTLDIVLGCFYLTGMRDDVRGAGRAFSSAEEVWTAFNLGQIHIQAKIKFLLPPEKAAGSALVETSAGRVIFNTILPPEMPFLNDQLNNKGLKRLLAKVFEKSGNEATAELADKIKSLGFRFATVSGTTLAVSDIAVPEAKKEVLAEAEDKVEKVNAQYAKGLLTDYERYILTVNVWRRATSDIEKLILSAQEVLGPVHNMLSSGTRGNIAQLTQMGGMKGLVVNPAGETIEMPITSNFKEGLSALEYFISTHGARKGRSDTALRTADAGYLTRRLVDVSQDAIVTLEDCGTKEGIVINKLETKEIGENFSDRLRGRMLLEDVKVGKKVLYKQGAILDANAAQLLEENEAVFEVSARSPLACEADWGVCANCYGWDLARNKLAAEGTAVGVMAAQSIGEPGTQLTMRTFHTGGVLGKDITQGLPRVEELFEARTPRDAAPLAEMDGIVKILEQAGKKTVRLTSSRPMKVDFAIAEGYTVLIENNAQVQVKQALASGPNKPTIRSTLNGMAKVSKGKITIEGEGKVIKDYPVLSNQAILIKDGQVVAAGDALLEGSLSIQQLLLLKGRIPAQRYIVHEVQQIYSSQGQVINEKHIEVVVRQMFSKGRVRETGDSKHLPGAIVDRLALLRENAELAKKGKDPIEIEELVLGITKASLLTDSFLSAASFQETTSILVEAAVSGKYDNLRGLKENTIIGRLIPSGTGWKERRTP